MAFPAHRYPFGDNIIKGTATINRKTSYGTTSKEVVTLNVMGTGYDPPLLGRLRQRDRPQGVEQRHAVAGEVDRRGPVFLRDT